MLKPSVQLRLGQQLTMTPQLQQAIKLLQYSTVELQGQIQTALEENPMLELAEADEHADEGDTEAATGDEHAEVQAEGSDDDWESLYGASAVHLGSNAEDRDPFENQSRAETLHDHLSWQLDLLPMSERDRAIAVAIVDSVDDSGYLMEGLEALHEGLTEAYEVEADEIEAVRHLVQHLDPVGCAASDLAECLTAQIDELPEGTPWRDEARHIVSQHLAKLASHDHKSLLRASGLSQGELDQVIGLIQGLEPRPGSAVGGATTGYVVPDVFVRRVEGVWRVELNPEVVPPLRINQLYANLVKRADASADNKYLRSHLQEARWFIKSLQSRNETLLQVASAIVEQQRGFLEHGDEAMRPLILRDIAEQLEMHESTISRVTTQKYMHTPRGVFEFKYFFSSHVATSDGGECSATAIRAMIRRLIAEESPGQPLSDSKIAATLVERGIHVARRTVAKYREGLAIPPSSERKRPA